MRRVVCLLLGWACCGGTANGFATPSSLHSKHSVQDGCFVGTRGRNFLYGRGGSANPQHRFSFGTKLRDGLNGSDGETTNGIESSGADTTTATAISNDDNEENGKGSKLDWDAIVDQSKLFFEMASPYFKESKSGRWLFAGMIGMTLLNSGVSVAFSYLGKDFWNALSAKDADQFYEMLLKFGAALVVGAPVAVFYRFQRERVSVSWREWMTERTLKLYSNQRVYYALERNSDIDNPDQRIAEDVRTFTTYSLQLFITLVTSVIDLVSFSAILYSIQPQLFATIVAYATFGTVVTTLLGQRLVGLNFLKLQKEADFRYALVRLRENAESIAFYAGEELEEKNIVTRFSSVIENKRDLIGAQRNLEFFTTAYQYLIQVVPVAVVAPQYFAGQVQLGIVSQSAGAFNHILSDLSIIVQQFEQLSSFSAGIDRLSQFYKSMKDVDILKGADSPLLEVVNTTQGALPAYPPPDGPAMQNGAEITGTNTALGSLSTIALHRYQPTADEAAKPRFIVSIDGLRLQTPDRKRVLIDSLDLELSQGEDLLIVGASGAGKSSLLRAIAGLWNAGEGTISRPADEDVYFLPQRPYCALGSLRDQMLYPSIDQGRIENTNGSTDDGAVKEDRTLVGATNGQIHAGTKVGTKTERIESLSDESLLEILEAVDLGNLASIAGDGDAIKGLNAVKDWSNMLSLGEQQRLAFGRVLVNQPSLVILDEATSALDMVAEGRMYGLLRNLATKRIKSGRILDGGLTFISVGHRPSLLAYHDKRLRLQGDTFQLSNIEKSTTDLPQTLSNL